MSGFIEDAAPEEDLGHRSILGRAPGLKGGNELSLIDQPPLECEQAEKEFAGCVGASRHGVQSGPSADVDEGRPLSPRGTEQRKCRRG